MRPWTPSINASKRNHSPHDEERVSSPMDVDVPTPASVPTPSWLRQEQELENFVASLSLPESQQYRMFLQCGGTDIEIFKEGMARRKQELDETMEAERKKLAKEEAIRRRPLIQDSFTAIQAQRERTLMPSTARAKLAQAALAGNMDVAMPAIKSPPLKL